jgi:hypothetical protein
VTAVQADASDEKVPEAPPAAAEEMVAAPPLPFGRPALSLLGGK